MHREFTDKEVEIFNKLAPEAGGSMNSPMGHPYPFILRPISHKFAESSEDFGERLKRLDVNELEFLTNLIFEGKEEVRSLDPEDIDVLMEVIAKKISPERVDELKDYLGIL
ncbi:MAG: hypothetical protein P1P69_02625 [Methanosarcinaceae archaeon]|nr:hypothetical protein [Methanosarcinaceae archaeon]MDF1533383.1 hypothetical protein [Methanosarcinaceae archaeon]